VKFFPTVGTVLGQEPGPDCQICPKHLLITPWHLWTGCST